MRLMEEKDMREKINRLANGILDREIPELALSPERFDDVLPADLRRRYDLVIDTDGIFRLKGLCYSDDPRVRPETRAFMGRRCHVVFCVDTSFLKPGETIEGSLSLITNAGELSLPYHFDVASEASQGVPDYLAELRDGEELFEGDAEEAFGEDGSAASEPEADQEDAGEEEYLAALAERLPEDDELLSELCGLLISMDRTDGFAFSVYREAVLRDIKLTRLYEYYIYSCPEDLSEEMPRSVLLYFSYDNSLEPSRKEGLYKNILMYQDPDSELYASYEPQIRDYAMASMFERRIDEKLALIYDRMIYPDMVDRKAAMILPDILKSHHISLADRKAAYVKLRCPQLSYEERYPIRDHSAYVPLYFEDTRIVFCDAAGNELNVRSYEDRAMMNRPDLLRRCFEIYPDHPMLKLAAARNVLKKGAADETEEEILRDAYRSLKLSVEFREEVIRELCRREGGSASFRKEDLDPYTDDIRGLIYSALIRDGYYEDAYLRLRRYGTDITGEEELGELVSYLAGSGSIPVIQGETDEFFTLMCRKAFCEGLRDKAVTAFLAREYEGSTEEMYEILEACRELGCDTGELPEKVLTSKLFAGTGEHLDESFNMYIRKGEQKEAIIRAYLTVRCSEYFEKEDESLADEFFDILYSYVSSAEDYSKLPDIYLLALTKHYQEKGSLLPNETELCQKLTDILIGNGLIFRYTKALKKKIVIPKEICERYYIEYHGSREAPPRLYVRISPEDKDYHREEMRRVYGGIYVAGTVLFVEDELHYMIYDDSVSDSTVQEGTISVKKLHSREDDRYAMLDRMTKELKEQDASALSEDMKEYMVRDRQRRALFDIG